MKTIVTWKYCDKSYRFVCRKYRWNTWRDSPSIFPSALSHFWSVIGAASFFFPCWQCWVNLSIRNDTWKSDVSRSYVVSVDGEEKTVDSDISLVQPGTRVRPSGGFAERSRDIIRCILVICQLKTGRSLFHAGDKLHVSEVSLGGRE